MKTKRKCLKLTFSNLQANPCMCSHIKALNVSLNILTKMEPTSECIKIEIKSKSDQKFSMSEIVTEDRARCLKNNSVCRRRLIVIASKSNIRNNKCPFMVNFWGLKTWKRSDFRRQKRSLWYIRFFLRSIELFNFH